MVLIQLSIINMALRLARPLVMEFKLEGEQSCDLSDCILVSALNIFVSDNANIETF